MKVLTIYGTLALALVIITGFGGMDLHLPWSVNPHRDMVRVGIDGVVDRAGAFVFQVEALVLSWQRRASPYRTLQPSLTPAISVP